MEKRAANDYLAQGLFWFDRFWRAHRGKTLGGILGGLFAILVMRYGFLWTMFIVICVGTGLWIGHYFDAAREDITDFIDRILPPGRR